MRYARLFFITAVSLLLIGTISVKAEDGVPGQPFKNLQNQIDDHETRITDLEQQTSTAAPRVYDAEGSFLGILLGQKILISYVIEVFVPGINKIVIFDLKTGLIQSYTGTPFYYSEPGCAGDAYISSYWINELIFVGKYNGTRLQLYTCDTSTEVEVEVRSYGSGAACIDEYQASFKGSPITVLPDGVLPLLPPDYDRVATPFQYQSN